MQSLALKYRPTTFSDVCSQGSTTVILENQLRTGTFKQAYIFTGPAGCGKTTCARILANEINGGHGNPIELDAASNNSVDNIREIINQAKTKSLDSEYKVYILDEVHMLSAGAWAAMLKLIEEPPAKTIFILATTDIQKVPATILSRCQRFDFARIPLDIIIERLKYVLDQENKTSENPIQYDEDALNYIASLADGGMRAALTLTDKVLSYSQNIDIETVIKALGAVDYETMFDLYKGIYSDNVQTVVIIENLYFSGKDLKQFMKSFMKFVLDVRKYQITGTLEFTSMPSIYADKMKQVSNMASADYTSRLLTVLIQLNADLKWDTNAKALIEATLLTLRGEK